VNAVNRVLVGLIGLSLLAAGVLGVAATWGWLEEDDIDAALPFRRAWNRWRDIDWDTAATWVLLGAAIVALLLGLALLVAELWVRRDPRGGRFPVTRGPRGATTLRLGRLGRALAHEAETVAGVHRSRVECLEVDGTASARLRLEVDSDAEVPRVGAEVVERAAASLGRILERPPGPVTAIVEVRPERARREDDRRVE
jgi:hypothetical protein